MEKTSTGILQALRARGVADSETDRMAWHAARAEAITATEAAQLRRQGVGFRRQLITSKLGPVGAREIRGNKWIDRGHQREPIIADWVAARFPGLQGNSILFAAVDNPRHRATPDGYGLIDGELVLVEIKTSKYDLDPTDPRSHYPLTGYWEQTLWQMHVCGARRVLFVWEQHDDDWENGPMPLDLEPRYAWIEYDADEVGRMIAEADRALAELDYTRAVRSVIAADDPAEIPTAGDRTTLQLEIDVLGLAVLSAREAETETTARKETVWKQLQTKLQQVKADSWTGLSKVTWTPPSEVTETVVDDEAAADAPVEGLDDVTGNDLLLDLERAQKAWNEHRARFTKQKTTTKKANLTVTAPKADKK